MSLDADQMYALLPAVYRTRDAVTGGQLRALFGVLAAQSDIVDGNLRQLYDDHFIETCAPWVIPYIGDLLGYNSVYEIAAATDSRAEVANTVGYRRRKGTKIALQQVAIDVSGRAAVVVEEFQRLIATQSMRLVRPRNLATVSVRHAGRLLEAASGNGIADSPFDLTSRAIDVRRIAPRALGPSCADPPVPDATPLDMALHGPGRASLPDVGIHLWRWQAYPVTRAAAFPVDGPGGRRYRFSPLGADLPLFTPLSLPESFTAYLTRGNVPQPIARAELARFYGPAGALLLTADGIAVDAGLIVAANLAGRSLPAAGSGSSPAGGPDGTWCTVPAGMIAIDPELGRIQLAADVPVPEALEVTYWYGLPAPIGGGPYDRSASLDGVAPDSPDFTGFTAAVGSADYPTLEDAVAGWNSYATAPQPAGVITLPGFASLTAAVTGTAAIQLPPGGSLAIVAAPYDNALVTLTGDIEVTGRPPAADAPGPTASGTTPASGRLLLSGVWLAGQLTVSGHPCTVTVSDCTLVPGHGLVPDGTSPDGTPLHGAPLHPGEPSVVVTAEGGASLVLTRVISGPVAATEGGTTQVTDSILDATSPYYVAHAGPDLASPGPDLSVAGSTVIGKVRARTMTLASDSIFHARLGDADPWLAPVWASRRQAGCVRFCSLPANSITPRQYRCLPPGQATEEAYAGRFVTIRYGHPSYAMLSGDCPVAVWTGAGNGSQLGVYQQAQETEAVRNIQIRAPEYLPARLEAGVFLHPAHATPHPRRPGGYGYGHWSGSGSGPQPGDGFTGIGADLI